MLQQASSKDSDAAPSIAVIGTPMIDFLVEGLDELPERGTVAQVNTFERQLGGCALNAAVVASRLGAKVTLFTWLPTADSESRVARAERDEVIAYANNAGVSVQVVGSITAIPSSIVVIGSDKNRSFITFKTPVDSSDAVDLKPHLEVLKTFDCVFFSGVGPNERFTGDSLSSILKSLSTSSHADATGSVRDVTFPHPLIALDIVAISGWDKAKWNARIGRMMHYVHAFFPNDDELAQFEPTGVTRHRTIANTVNGIASVLESHPRMRIVGVKRSSDGCVVGCTSLPSLWIGGRSKDSECFQAPTILRGGNTLRDQTGAGDSWCGGFLAHWLRDKDPRLAALAANAAASVCVKHLGATKYLTSVEMLEAIEISKDMVAQIEDVYRAGMSRSPSDGPGEGIPLAP
jgi:sugar/nucleoside kinase (ribokinase family)